MHSTKDYKNIWNVHNMQIVYPKCNLQKFAKSHEGHIRDFIWIYIYNDKGSPLGLNNKLVMTFEALARFLNF